MKKAAFIGFGEVNTPIDLIINKCKKAAEELSLSKADVKDILCNNAANLFGIKF